MSKGFKITLLFLAIFGLLMLNYIFSNNCDNYHLNQTSCAQRFMCKFKVIRTQKEVEQDVLQEMRSSKKDFNMGTPRAETQCIPIYKF